MIANFLIAAALFADTLTCHGSHRVCIGMFSIDAPCSYRIVQAYVARHVMPRSPVGDALHLALASHHRCDFLLTWNCRHLANANKFDHIRRVNTLLGLFVPALVTPLELTGEDDENS